MICDLAIMVNGYVGAMECQVQSTTDLHFTVFFSWRSIDWESWRNMTSTCQVLSDREDISSEIRPTLQDLSQ